MRKALLVGVCPSHPVKMWPAVAQKSKMATKKHMKKNHILLGHCFGACVVIREH